MNPETAVKPQHTPTPWKLSKYGSIAHPQKECMSVPINAASSDSPEATANAAFIVRAVNAHEELVSLLKEGLGARDDSWYERVKQALAKAEGKE